MKNPELKLIEKKEEAQQHPYAGYLNEYHELIFSLPIDITQKCAMVTKLHELIYQHAKYWMEYTNFKKTETN